VVGQFKRDAYGQVLTPAHVTLNVSNTGTRVSHELSHAACKLYTRTLMSILVSLWEIRYLQRAAACDNSSLY